MLAKRSGSSSKKTREKYEVLFKNEENTLNDEITVNENLLSEIINSSSTINFETFENEVLKCNFEQALFKKNFNLLLNECIHELDGK